MPGGSTALKNKTPGSGIRQDPENKKGNNMKNLKIIKISNNLHTKLKVLAAKKGVSLLALTEKILAEAKELKDVERIL